MSFILQRLIRFTAQQISALVAGVVGQKADGTLIGIDGLPISVSATPGGSSGAIQYNNGGSLGGFGSFNNATNQANFPGEITGIQLSLGGTAGVYARDVYLLSNSSFIGLGTSVDTVLMRGGAGIFEQRNSTNAQNFRVFNTGDSTNGEWFGVDWQTTANVVTVGAQRAGSGSNRILKLVSGNNSVSLSPDFGRVEISTGWLSVPGAQGIYLAANAFIKSTSIGSIKLSNENDNGFNLLQFGGVSSSFPAIRRSGAVVEIVLADASNYTNLIAANLVSAGVVRKFALTVATLPAAATWSGGDAYVTDSLAPVVGAVVASGGAAKALVSSNGTNWIVTATL